LLWFEGKKLRLVETEVKIAADCNANSISDAFIIWGLLAFRIFSAWVLLAAEKVISKDVY